MNRQEIVSIAITAGVGFLFGMYIFWSGFLVNFGTPDVPTQDDLGEFTLVSEVYGSCGSTCPSFRVLADGSYRYLFTPAFGEAQTVRDGTIPRSLRRELMTVITAADLDAQSRKIQPIACNSYTDGIDVLYRITYQGTDYEIDTCGTAINTDSALWDTLVKTWNYFETGES